MSGSRRIPVAEGLFTWPSDHPRLDRNCARCVGCGLITFPAGPPASGAAGRRHREAATRPGHPVDLHLAELPAAEPALRRQRHRRRPSSPTSWATSNSRASCSSRAGSSSWSGAARDRPADGVARSCPTPSARTAPRSLTFAFAPVGPTPAVRGEAAPRSARGRGHRRRRTAPVRPARRQVRRWTWGPRRRAPALADAGIGWSQVQAGSSAASRCPTRTPSWRWLGLTGIPLRGVFNGCATGGTALSMAARAIETGEADVAIAIGMDKHPRGAFAADPSVVGLPPGTARPACS